MPKDVSLRGFSDDEHASLKLKAAESGKSLEAWGKETLIKAAQAPTVKQRYILQANTGPAFVEIRRTEDSISDPRPFYSLLSVDQRIAFDMAIVLVKRNEPGDREAAYAALAKVFENVRER